MLGDNNVADYKPDDNVISGHFPDLPTNTPPPRMEGGPPRGPTMLEERVTKLETKMDSVLDTLKYHTARFDKIDSKFDKVNEKFDKMHESLGKMQSQIDKLPNKMFLGFLSISGSLIVITGAIFGFFNWMSHSNSNTNAHQNQNTQPIVYIERSPY